MDDSNEKSSSIKNISSSQNTLKTISLNFLNSNNYNLNDAQIFENNKENSYYDKDLNEKIIKLFIGDHPLLPMKTIEKIAHCNFMNQHYKGKDYYNTKVIDQIIHNESTHVVAEFKEYLIKGDTSEFLMQYYKKKEIYNLLPKIFECYISCSVIFPNYVTLPESKYIYKNIKKKQRVIDVQQEQEDREENIKNGLYEQEKEPTIFTTQAFDSILNQTDTSGVKQWFDVSKEHKSNNNDDSLNTDLIKIKNVIENAEKKAGNNSKKNKINVCKLKKGNNEFQNQYQYKKNITLNDGGGNNKKLQSAYNNKKGERKFFHENNNNLNINNINNLNDINIIHDEKIKINKNNLKQIIRQTTENNNNNNYHKKNNFSTQITYIDSYNHHLKNAFDLKGIESIKKTKISNNQKEPKNDNKENKDIKDKQISKNNSQTYSSFKKGINENNNNYNENYKENSENISINQSDIKIKIKEKNNINKPHNKKEFTSRNNNYPIYQFDSNIKTFCEDPFKFTNKSKNTITSYKTKNKSKNKTKGYQTSRNKYDNKNMYINISKSNISKNHQSIDSERNNYIIKKKMNQIQNKHNNIKNNIINALLDSQKNNPRKKISKIKDIIKQNNNQSSNDFNTDSIELKDIQDTNSNNNINKNNENIDKNQNSNKEEKTDKMSSTSCTKTMSINSYGSKPKNNFSSNNYNNVGNKMNNHKKQISSARIPNSVQENKIINNKINKKINKINEELENKNKLKEFIDIYLDDYFSSNPNINNNYIESKNKSKSKSKSKNKNEPLTVRYIHDIKKEKDETKKLRKTVFNFEKRITKKLSEKNLNIFDKFKTKSSPKNKQKQKASTIRINKSGNIQNSDRCCPLSARESNFKYQINAEIIELLSNKIQKIKQSLKETDKGSNSISSIFKKNKIPAAGRKPPSQPTKKSDDFIEKKKQNSKTRNKYNKNGLVGTISSNSNIGVNGNLVNTIINSIYQTNLLSPDKKNIEYDKLMKTFHKFKRPTNSFNGNNIINNKPNKNANNNNTLGKKDSKGKVKHGRYNSIYNNINNYENNVNIEVNIKNKQKQNNINSNNKQVNDNLNSLNINFNNYTNNYNYNINPGSNNTNNNLINNNTNITNININSNNYSNSIINKGKSSSQKMILGKAGGKPDNNFKGIPINGFDKLITKKYNTRNYKIPMSMTERTKQANIYATSCASNNTNRYRNSNRGHMTKNKIYQKK